MIGVLLAVIAVGLSFILFPDAWSRLRSSTVTHRPDQIRLYRNGQRLWGYILAGTGVVALVAWIVWGG